MSVCSHRKTQLHRTNFHEIWYLSSFLKSVMEVQVSLNLARITGTLHEDLSIFMISH